MRGSAGAGSAQIVGAELAGRRRHIATDTLGLLLAVIVTAASVQDSTAGRRLLDTVSADHPTVSKAWVDGGYNTAVRAHGARLGIDVEAGAPPGREGLPRPATPVDRGSNLRLADAAPAARA
ncbi:transposase [Micromonospora coxensis]